MRGFFAALRMTIRGILTNQPVDLSADFEHLLDAAEGLASALFIFDEGEADEVVAVFAEAYAGADCGLSVEQQFLRKLD